MVRTDRYSRGAIALHWVIAALVIANLAIGLFYESLFEGMRLMPAHKAIGITVIALTLVRIGWRLTHPVPPAPATLSLWEKFAAKATHRIFYVLMLLIPLSGWAMVSAAETPRPLDWFGLFPIPFLPVSESLGDIAHETHEIGGLLFAALVVLHIAAALRHHLLLKDGVLARMIPGITRS